MESRRDFIKKAALLSSSAGLMGILPPAIQRALAINPAEGSTFYDAEHIVILMQENRSFDHCYGTLQGVRGFNDPRAINLPNKNKVWLQSNATGETFAPFRLNLKDSKATWMSSLPHSWEDQVDARNDGKYDKWLHVKQSGHKEFKKMPLTLGYYTREDIPFYYALADAFTVCDQNFCSSLTGTTPNRLYLWTGTIREKADFESKANVKNEDVVYDRWASWKTFPERLEENGVSWKIYQNEISLPMDFEGEEEAWLANFGDNPIEYFEQYRVKFSPEYYKYLQKMKDILPKKIAELENTIQNLKGKDLEKAQNELSSKKDFYEVLKQDIVQYTPENFEKLSDFDKNLHKKAFLNNRNDPDYRKLTTLEYDDMGTKRQMQVPKGDVLYEFRKDVEKKELPMVSWIVAPENFSDHPSSPWYGAWYLSEVMDILTQNPEVWKKTIFILAYDENDGYFDHVPPFVAPNPDKPKTGKVSAGIDAKVEQVNLQHELTRPYKNPEKEARENPIGLGFRVPLLIASPWSRGGNICSEVFDHTSVLQFLEKFLQKKTKKAILESNISEWRRTVCGDLTASFKPYHGEKIDLPTFVDKVPFIESVHKAKFKKLPSNFKALSPAEIRQFNANSADLAWSPKQEKGIRKACALPYELYVEGKLSADKTSFEVEFEAGNLVFGKESAGCPYMVYYETDDLKTRNYAVKHGDKISDSWQLDDFLNKNYHLKIYGPNGFFRLFRGNTTDPLIEIKLRYQSKSLDNQALTGNVVLEIKNLDTKNRTLEISDLSYKTGAKTVEVKKGKTANVIIDLQKSHHWYDFSVKEKGNTNFEKQYAGHVETGKESYTDPAMGGI